MRPRRPMSLARSSRLTPALTLRTLAALGTSLLKEMSRAPFNTSFGVDVPIGFDLRDGWGASLPHGPVTKSPSFLFLSCRLTRANAEQDRNARPPSMREDGMRASGSAARPQVSSGNLIEEALGLELHVEPGILARLSAGEGRDALHKIKHRRRRVAFLSEHGVDDLGRIGFRKAAL